MIDQLHQGGTSVYIHLGGDLVVTTREIVAVIDMASTVVRGTVPGSLKPVVTIDAGDIKSLVITTNTNYFSPVSAVTLKKRMHSITEDRK